MTIVAPDVALAGGLALAAAVAFGLGSAAQQRVAAAAARGSGLVREPRWLAGVLGVVLSRLAFRAARSAAPVLAVLTTVDPLVAVAVGVCWLGERVAAAPAALAGELLAAAVVVGGIVVVVRAGEGAVVPG